MENEKVGIKKQNMVQGFVDLSEKQYPSRLPADFFVLNGKIYGICAGCEKLVRIDKPIIGSFHLCV